MSDARVLDDAPWLRSGPAARVLELLNGGNAHATFDKAVKKLPAAFLFLLSKFRNSVTALRRSSV